ncbi:MAG TPA: DNA polymerase IV [Longimicrobiaceae bacterium]|nr:DNA polymerase IV [Longimicrobiaceae bacterium]
MLPPPPVPDPPPRRILHVDVDAMFVQCAVMADPEGLADKSLILIGGRPEQRGVVASASYGCRAFGVRSAMPMVTALRLCPEATVVPVPREMVRAKSRELARVLEAWAPVTSMASVDEAYLDLTGTEALYHHEPLPGIARRIQRDVRERTGLDVSIGGGANRLVAKLATSFAKPRGVFIVPAGEEAEFVGRLRIGDLTGVGPALQEELRRRGVSSMQALRALDLATLAGWWGDDRARWLWERCRGIDSTPVAEDDITKSVSSETTFPRDLNTTEEMEEALLAQAVDAAAALRRKGLYARTITVKLRDGDFRDRSRSRTLEEAVQTDRAIFRVARELLRDLRRQRDASARLIGVALTNLTPTGESAQGVLLDLAPPVESERDRALAQAADRLRAKFGSTALQPGRLVRSPEEPGG